jgi:oxygen-independent coproporphyrinogen-3 oxidase
MDNPTKHEYGRILTEKEKLEEEIFLGFRKTEGVNVEKIKQKFDVNFESKYKKILDKYSDYIIKTKQGYALNLKGTMLSNEILPEFLSD